MVKHCCEDMRGQVEHVCDIHDSPFDCADHIIYYNNVFDEYGIIIHDGGSSYISISHCPFCGKRLPESKRERYFNILENDLNYSDEAILDNEIPEEFKSDEWWKKRNL